MPISEHNSWHNDREYDCLLAYVLSEIHLVDENRIAKYFGDTVENVLVAIGEAKDDIATTLHDYL